MTAIREKKHYSKMELSRKLELLGVVLDRFDLYKIENSKMIVKDFELIALSSVLDIDLHDMQTLLEFDDKSYAAV